MNDFTKFVTNIGKYIAKHFCDDRNELMHGITEVISDCMYKEKIPYESMIGSMWLNYPDFTMDLLNYIKTNNIDLNQIYQQCVEQKKLEKQKRQKEKKKYEDLIKSIYRTVYGFSDDEKFVRVDDKIVPKSIAKYYDYGCSFSGWDIKPDKESIVNDVYYIVNNMPCKNEGGC